MCFLSILTLSSWSCLWTRVSSFLGVLPHRWECVSMERYPTTGTHSSGRQLSGEFRSDQAELQERRRSGLKTHKKLQYLAFSKQLCSLNVVNFLNDPFRCECLSLFHSWCGINMDYTFSLPDWITGCKALGGTHKSEWLKPQTTLHFTDFVKFVKCSKILPQNHFCYIHTMWCWLWCLKTYYHAVHANHIIKYNYLKQTIKTNKET